MKDNRVPRAGAPRVGLRPPQDASAILGVLSKGEIEVKGRLRWSSNATFLVAVHPPSQNSATAPTPVASSTGGPSPGRAAEGPMLAIYKPAKGERPLWDFPRGLWKREVAAYELASSLSWDLVPPTAARRDAPLGAGSLQYCVDAQAGEHYFSLLDEPSHHMALRRIAAFDLIVNNADRKSGHCLLDRCGHIWAIDNGLCFHAEPKLRTVVWDFAGEQIDDELLTSLEPLSRAEVPAVMADLLDEEEIKALSDRAAALFEVARYPEPSGDFPYPWPLV